MGKVNAVLVVKERRKKVGKVAERLYAGVKKAQGAARTRIMRKAPLG